MNQFHLSDEELDDNYSSKRQESNSDDCLLNFNLIPKFNQKLLCVFETNDNFWSNFSSKLEKNEIQDILIHDEEENKQKTFNIEKPKIKDTLIIELSVMLF